MRNQFRLPCILCLQNRYKRVCIITPTPVCNTMCVIKNVELCVPWWHLRDNSFSKTPAAGWWKKARTIHIWRTTVLCHVPFLDSSAHFLLQEQMVSQRILVFGFFKLGRLFLPVYVPEDSSSNYEEISCCLKVLLSFHILGLTAPTFVLSLTRTVGVRL
jgi:hypothetical protein